jgi:hypothetical protein
MKLPRMSALGENKKMLPGKLQVVLCAKICHVANFNFLLFARVVQHEVLRT